jgi:hypothetical protein
MKNALLLSLALIAVGPVAVEGQRDEGPREESIALVNSLIEGRTCELRPARSGYSETCRYRIPGLEFRIIDASAASPREVQVIELGQRFNGNVRIFSDHMFLISWGSVPGYLAMATICLGRKNRGKFVRDAYGDCY